MSLTLEAIRLYVLGFALIPVCVLGLIGNALCAVVLSSKEMKSSVSWLVLGLSACDSWYLICSLIIDGIPVVYHNFFGQWIPENSFAIEAAAQTGSIYFTIAISVERFIVVTYPLQARNLCTNKIAKISSTCLIVYSILFGLTYYFLYKASYALAGDLILTIFQFLIPLVLLVYLNAKIYLNIKTAAITRSDLCQCTKTDISITRMLLVVVFVFGVSYIPLLFEFIIYHYNNLKRELMEDGDVDFEVSDPFWEVVPIVARLSVCINCAINFLVYCVAGSKFREVFIKSCGEYARTWGCKRSPSVLPNSSLRSIISRSQIDGN